MAYACDRDGCDSYQHQARARAGWLSVVELGHDDRLWHFCSTDCLLMHFGRRAPGEEIPFHQGG